MNRFASYSIIVLLLFAATNYAYAQKRNFPQKPQQKVTPQVFHKEEDSFIFIGNLVSKEPDTSDRYCYSKQSVSGLKFKLVFKENQPQIYYYPLELNTDMDGCFEVKLPKNLLYSDAKIRFLNPVKFEDRNFVLVKRDFNETRILMLKELELCSNMISCFPVLTICPNNYRSIILSEIDRRGIDDILKDNYFLGKY